jgi:sugar/nucleoside kinase (ribokinase family)
MEEIFWSPSFHIIGDAFVDLLAFLEKDWPVPGGDSVLTRPVRHYAGGSALNTATQLVRLLSQFASGALSNLPAPVSLYSALNEDDEYGRILSRHARTHGFRMVNCFSKESVASTGHCIAIIAEKERTFMTHSGCIQSFSAQHVDVSGIGKAEVPIHVHISGYFNLPKFWNGVLQSKLQCLRNMRHTQSNRIGRNTTISLSTQHDASNGWDRGLREVIPLLDFLFLNELEATNILTNFSDSAALLFKKKELIEQWASCTALLSYETCFIITRGSHGALALRGGKTVVDIKKSVSVDVVDPTGAGDAFAAGFLAGSWKSMVKSTLTDPCWPDFAILEGMLWGCAAGTSVVGIVGASVPPQTELFTKLVGRYRQEYFRSN